MEPIVLQLLGSLHEGMGKSDFGAVDGTIAASLEDGEVISVSGVEDDAVHNFLYIVRRCCQTERTYLP